METLASKAQHMQMELQGDANDEEIFAECSDSSAPSQAHTEELAARLDEMGVLAANLARMVEESKNKLNHLQESSMARSPASLHHHGKWSEATSHRRQISGSNVETMTCGASVHSQSYTASINTVPATPLSVEKVKGLSILKPASLRKKVSLTSWPRKSTVCSTVPFPSEKATLASRRVDDASTGQTPARSQQENRAAAASPRVYQTGEGGSRSNLTRASSGRGRALSHFLTRYGSRNTRSASIFKTSYEMEDDVKKETSATMYDRSDNNEGVYSNITSTKTRASMGLSKHFFDDDGPVDVGPTDYSKQSKTHKGGPSISTSRHMSRIYQSPAASPVLASRKQSISGTPGRQFATHATPAAVGMPKSPTAGSQRERTLSKMKSFTLGRSNTTSTQHRRGEAQRDAGESKATKDRSVKQSSSRLQNDSLEMSTASSPSEPSSPRLHQHTSSTMTPLTPLIGEDPPRHHQRSRESSSQSHQLPHLVNSPSTPGGGLWTRLFRGNNHAGSGSSGRFQSPRGI